MGTTVQTAHQLCTPSIAAPSFSVFAIGGLAARLVSDANADVTLFPPIDAFAIAVSDCACDINIRVVWVPSIRRHSGPKVFDSGTTWRLYDFEVGLEFDFHSARRSPHPYKRMFVDHKFKQALVQMSEESFADLTYRQPLGYPLDELLIMHRLTQEKAIELHGTGIVRPNGDANLFIGHSGAGKSTTTRLWTDIEDVEVLSDDRIIVRRDESSPTRIRMYGTPWHGEAMFASPNSAPLTRIFVLEHGHGNVITPLSPSQAVAELFARSFVPFHRHEYVESALVFLEELANAVPVYRYAFEPDQSAVEKILHFHD
ncbi:MAG TPA: hypothetical protein VGS27_25240 [Candidatus Sulfotelmatobacter sp.]|nr:hypothetical protein [Candidatus Sulfotelmatobacter sp.]